MTSALETFAFDALFDEVIAPALAPQEAMRKRLWVRFWWGVPIVLAVAVAAAFAASRFFPGIWPPVIAVGAALFIGAFPLYMPLQNLGDDCKVEVLNRLAAALGLTYQAEPRDPPGFREAYKLGLLPAFDRSKYEDLFSGAHRGLSFDIYEARLEEETDSKENSYRTVFAGQAMRIAFPKAFLGVTVVNRQSQRRWKSDGFQRVGLGSSAEFERAFEVFGTDQVEARYLVHPAFMQRLIELEAVSGSKELRCAFSGGDLLIAMEGPNMFEVVSTLRPIPDRALTAKGVEQIRGLFAVIDQVLDPPRPQWGAAK